MTEQLNTDIQEGVKKETAISTLRDALMKPAGEFDPSLPLFIGTLKEQHGIIFKTAANFIGMRDAINEGLEREAEVLKSNYDELREEHFPEVDEEQLAAMLMNYFRFYYSSLDRGLVRDDTIDLVRNSKPVNTVPLKNGSRMSLVKSVTPSTKSNLNVHERMRRSFLQAAGGSDSFTVTLPTSLIVLRVKVPTPTDLVRLINDIVNKLRHYGERYNLSSLHLERAGIGKILVDFILSRITYHSVKGISDPYELKSLIYSSDLNSLAQALLVISSPRGVSFRMECLAHKCGFSENTVIDPSAMLLYTEDQQPEDRKKLLFEIVNDGRKLSREELLDNPPIFKDKDGEPLKTSVDFLEGRGRLNIGVPFLSEYFTCYDQMAERVNKELRELAVDFPNPKIFAERRKEYLATLRGAEYLQWFRSYEIDPMPGEEGEKDVILREEDSLGFDDGLIDIFNKSDDLYASAMQLVLTTAPRMTYTFVGIMDNTCPKCKKAAEGPISDMLPSFTPIDPILNFFAHTRMMISLRAMQATTQEESLS